MEGKAGEVRRIHIIYFLSRMGRIEQPHLIRVHHLTRNGVFLRDVKRWLADLRGKDMPDAFSWSYKRRYRNGYVWQDLLDDNLITPISDNEYVLQGSELLPTSFEHSSYSSAEIKASDFIEQPTETEAGDKHQPESPKQGFQRHPDTKFDVPLKNQSEINEESPKFGSERSTITDVYDSMKLEEDKNMEETTKEHEQSEKLKDHSFYSNLLNKKNKKNSNSKYSFEKDGMLNSSISSSSSSSRSSFSKSKSYANGASNMFRNLITCGAIDTNDTVLITTNRSDKAAMNQSMKKHCNPAEICREEKLGGSARVFGTCWDKQLEYQQQNARRSYDYAKESRKKRHNEFTGRKTVLSAYKPVRGPSCSQCGKTFRPEKMHAHMKSCRGIKSLAKTASKSEKPHSRPKSSHKESPSGYLLTN